MTGSKEIIKLQIIKSVSTRAKLAKWRDGLKDVIGFGIISKISEKATFGNILKTSNF